MKCELCGQAVKLNEGGTTRYYIPMEAEILRAQVAVLERGLDKAKERLSSLLSSIDVILKVDDDTRDKRGINISRPGRADVILPPSPVLTLAMFAKNTLAEIAKIESARKMGDW